MLPGSVTQVMGEGGEGVLHGLPEKAKTGPVPALLQKLHEERMRLERVVLQEEMDYAGRINLLRNVPRGTLISAERNGGMQRFFVAPPTSSSTEPLFPQ